MSRDHGLAVTVAVCSFEPQEGLPAVSDLRQGVLAQKIVPEIVPEIPKPQKPRWLYRHFKCPA